LNPKTVNDEYLYNNISLIRKWKDNDAIAFEGLNKLAFGTVESEGEMCNIIKFFKDIFTTTNYVQVVKDADNKIAALVPCISVILAHLSAISVLDVKKQMSDMISNYTRDRNYEGTYINDTLREIQNALIAKSIKERGNIGHNPIDMCAICVCHPFLPKYPCFDTSDTHGTVGLSSKIIDALDLDNAYVIMMGVVDIGDGAKNPVPWLYDDNIQQIAAIKHALTQQPMLEHFYKYHEAFSGIKKIDTTLGELATKISKYTTIPSLTGTVESKITKLRDLYKQHNQASVIGTLHFLDTISKSGSAEPCMRIRNDTTPENMFGSDIVIVATLIG
jgi:hypothetical protein